jgi:hypothetical protein
MRVAAMELSDRLGAESRRLVSTWGSHQNTDKQISTGTKIGTNRNWTRNEGGDEPVVGSSKLRRLVAVFFSRKTLPHFGGSVRGGVFR